MLVKGATGYQLNTDVLSIGHSGQVILTYVKNLEWDMKLNAVIQMIKIEQMEWINQISMRMQTIAQVILMILQPTTITSLTESYHSLVTIIIVTVTQSCFRVAFMYIPETYICIYLYISRCIFVYVHIYIYIYIYIYI